MGFGETLKRIRLEKGMSQEEFATLLNTSKQNISRYEAGTVSPKITTAAGYAEILHMTLSELYGEENQFDQQESFPTITPQTPEARILCAGIDQMPEDARKKAVEMMNLVVEQYRDYCMQGGKEG